MSSTFFKLECLSTEDGFIYWYGIVCLLAEIIVIIVIQHVQHSSCSTQTDRQT